MADLSPEEAVVFEAIRDRISRMTGIPTDRFPAPKIHSLQADARAAVAALDLPARDARVRAAERAAVRAELLALVDEHGVCGECSLAGEFDRWAADRIAPEHTTPREKP